MLRSTVLLMLVAQAMAQSISFEAGCSDGTREWFSPAQKWPNIAGCRGRFLVPGVTSSTQPSCSRRAGNNGANTAGTGCTAADLCAPGWHVCRNHVEVRVLYGGTDPCDSVSGVFYATAQSFASSGNCRVSYSGTDDLFGCAGEGFGYSASNCGVLRRAISTTSCPPGWVCGSNDRTEGQNSYNAGDNGGVLCCKDEPVCQSGPGQYCSTSGCSDDERDNFLSKSTHQYIAGCSGAWSLPGIRNAAGMINTATCSRNSGDLSSNPTGIGCRAADLCPAGWEICESDAEVGMWSGSAFCDPNGVTEEGFFATGQRSEGSKCSFSTATVEGMLGCGADQIREAPACESLYAYSGEACSGPSTGGAWKCSDNTELSSVTKSTSSFGGVLCCQKQFSATNLCPVGTFSVGNSVQCNECPQGTYSDSMGQSSCKSCSAGKYAPNTRSSTCLDCEVGSTSLDGASSCFAAPTPSPTSAPTSAPTSSPTPSPTPSPTQAPTNPPVATLSPTLAPTAAPSRFPTFAPTLSPTFAPTLSPTTSAPTVAPVSTPPGNIVPVPGSGAPTSVPVQTESPSETASNEPTPPPTASAAAKEPKRNFSGFPRAAIIAVGIVAPSLLVLCVIIGYNRFQKRKEMNKTMKVDKYLLSEKASFVATDTGAYRKYTHL